MEHAKRCSISIPNAALCILIWILVTYIALTFDTDKLQSFSRGMSPPSNGQWGLAADGSEDDEKCKTRNGHFEDDAEGGGGGQENPWNQVKWIGQPAACPVRGKVIERLDPVNNFRRSSIQWFLQMYPCDFTEVHAFEIQDKLLLLPSPFDEELNVEVANTASLMARARPDIPGWMLRRIKVYDKLVGDSDDSGKKAINITRFIKDELRLTADDAVIVKMDIEESEWPVLERWSNDPDMVDIIDEIFVEVHYKHKSMYKYGWQKFKRERKEAKRLLADLRWKGFYVHFWP